jgi:hypothetical protein
MGEAQRRWQEKQKAERQAVAWFKYNNPERFAGMMEEARQREVKRLKAEEGARVAEEERRRLLRTSQQQLRVAVIPRVLPEVKGLEEVRGIIALRQWGLNQVSQLTSIGHSSEPWYAQMIADKPPTEYNRHGLYCIQLTAGGLMKETAERIQGGYCGLVELRGHCEFHDHEAGVRAEWARILAVFVTDSSSDVYFRLPHLMENYPTVSIFVTTEDLVAKYLLRLVMWQETGDRTYLYNMKV